MSSGPNFGANARPGRPGWGLSKPRDCAKDGIHQVSLCPVDQISGRTPGHNGGAGVYRSLAHLRLHAPDLAYTGSYDTQALRDWAAEIGRWRAADRDVYCFVDNDEQAYQVRNALALAELRED